jgi:3-oxoacyl-[acyl-carrier-protein] synthase-3
VQNSTVALVLHAVASALGELKDIGELAEVRENPDAAVTLRHLGLARYARSEDALVDLARRSCEATLARAGINGADVDALVFATLGDEGQTRTGVRQLHAELGLTTTPPVGLFGSECSNLATALRLAADMLVARELEHVLVVTVDRAREGARLMEGMASVFSDGAASCLLSTEGDWGFALEGIALHCDPAMWDVDIGSDTVGYMKGSMAGAARALNDCLEQVGVERTSLKRVLTNNYNRSVLSTYAAHLGCSRDHMFADNAALVGHCHSADTLINLQTLSDSGGLSEGDHCVLLVSGFNTWGAVALRGLNIEPSR